jgi:hypothetical protein
MGCLSHTPWHLDSITMTSQTCSDARLPVVIATRTSFVVSGRFVAATQPERFPNFNQPTL